MEITDEILERDYFPLNKPCDTTVPHIKKPYICSNAAQIILNNLPTQDWKAPTKPTFRNSELHYTFYEISTLATTIVQDYTLIRTAGVYRLSSKGAVLQDNSNKQYYVHLAFETFAEFVNGSAIEIQGSVSNHGKTVNVFGHRKIEMGELGLYALLYKKSAKYARRELN